MAHFRTGRMEQHIARGFCVVVCLQLLMTVIGCGKGDGPQVVPVKGTVTRNGKPVADLFVNFKPASGRPSWAVTDANGRYELTFDAAQKGASVGLHTVWVTQPISGAEGMGPENQPKTSPELPAILKVYGREGITPLKIEVKTGSSEIDLKLD